MSHPNPVHEPVSPRVRRLWAFAWVGVVLSVSICVLLATWWSNNALLLASTPDVSSTQGTETAQLPTASTTPAEGEILTEASPPSGTPSSTATPLPILDASFGYGVIVQLKAEPELTLQQAQSLGVQWVRQPVNWSEIERTPGVYDWSTLDPVFVAAASYNMKVLVSVTGTPDWARLVSARGLDGPPSNMDTYNSFLSLLLTRYRGAIHAVEVWSEMNHDLSWYVAGGLNPTHYVDMLQGASQVIRQVDPGVLVISGGLLPTGIDDGVVAIDDFRYFSSLLDLDFLEYVDCVGVHHKGYNIPPDIAYDSGYSDEAAIFREPFSNLHHSWSFYSTLRGYHDMIIASGRDVPLCVTEFGWPVADSLPGEDLLEFANDNSPEEQADYIVRAFQLMRDWGFVRLAFVSNLDYSLEPGQEEESGIYYRLFLPDGSPRPAFEALQALEKRP